MFKTPDVLQFSSRRLLRFESARCIVYVSSLSSSSTTTVRVRVRFDLPAAIRVMQHVHSVWQSPSLGCRTKPLRDLDSNKEHERTMCSWFQQIGWTCKEANMGLCSCWTVSAVGKWPYEEEDEAYRCLVGATLSVSGGDFRLQSDFFGGVKRSVKMISLIWTLGHFFHNRTSSAGHSGFMPSPPEHLHGEWLSVFG